MMSPKVSGSHALSLPASGAAARLAPSSVLLEADFSLTFWMQSLAPGLALRTIAAESGNDCLTFRLFVNESLAIELPGYGRYISDTTFPSGAWQSVVVAMEEGNVTVWQSGTEVMRIPVQHTKACFAALEFGGHEGFKGLVDQVHLRRTALALQGAGPHPPDELTLVSWRCDSLHPWSPQNVTLMRHDVIISDYFLLSDTEVGSIWSLLNRAWIHTHHMSDFFKTVRLNGGMVTSQTSTIYTQASITGAPSRADLPYSTAADVLLLTHASELPSETQLLSSFNGFVVARAPYHLTRIMLTVSGNTIHMTLHSNSSVLAASLCTELLANWLQGLNATHSPPQCVIAQRISSSCGLTFPTQLHIPLFGVVSHCI